MTTPTREQVVQWAKESGLDLMPGNLHFDWSDRNLSAFTMLARADLEAENVSLNALNENYLAKIRELEAELDKVKGRYAENIAYNKELKAELKAELESLRNGLVIVGYAATNPNGYINLLNVYRKPPINKLQPGIVLIPLYAAAPKEKSEMEELDFKRVGPPRKSFTPAGKLTHAEIVAFKAAIFEAEPEGVEYISNLEAENAALKEELKAINAALDDPRTDLTMTACQVIAALKEQVAQLQVTPADKREDLRCVISDICAQARELQETIAQQAEALRVKDEALLAYPVRGEYFLEHLDATWMWDKALAIQPSPDILLERDARLVERINRHLLDIGDNCSDDPLQHIANQIRNGEINV